MRLTFDRIRFILMQRFDAMRKYESRQTCAAFVALGLDCEVVREGESAFHLLEITLVCGCPPAPSLRHVIKVR